MSADDKYLIVLVGPTAIGKTALAINLASHFHCEIISSDSRQFFKEMTIGTAVPSESELTAAKHHFIHNKSIFEDYTVGDFEKEAIATLDDLYQTNDFAVLVGGSGLYVDAILKGFDVFPDIEATVRREIAKEYDISGITWLQTELARHDPEYFKTVDTENPQRMMRALEVTLASGKPYSSFLLATKNTRRFTPIIIGLDAERDIIYDRINQRVDMMMDAGLLDEARKLYPYKSLNALQTVGYRELFSFFGGNSDLDFAVSEIKKNTRRFAKRQLTWFRKNENIKWFDYRTPDTEIADYIRSVVDSPR